MANEYRKITNMFELAQQGEEAAAFQQSYAQNPTATVRQYSHFFNTQLNADMVINNGTASIAYDRAWRN